MFRSILANSATQTVFWSLVTIGMYFLVKQLYRRWSFWWLMPLILAPILVALMLHVLHVSYHDYFRGTKWLVLLLGPVTVAFAIPIYEQRALIRKHWPVLLIGVIAGSLTSIFSSWALATLLGLDENLRLSLLPRSISTPFAMEVSRVIGGIPDLTAIFVIITGILGAVVGEVILTWLSLNSSLARGAFFGVGAHAAGTAQARKIGHTEGTIASVAMILVGLLNVFLLPLLSPLLK
ncbi:LrgB family protein [Fluoribacter dumoffii]|uniref:LrgB family protein n=1 Tax=Fluoribacter dumoffii TaxID=463 RepID=UPI00026C7B5B|nr:LrgB family protein [Fluoribacter dumoffii]MCW8416742.1 LrgB family protein [Fluoribacter dumoffii]MCW8455418.1 LrgB family protein [Fluoribacter dumoffii]MCW8460504.1 LrgB family protein [Fluoribacter dumoffii]MCW8483985.1 LrgB family protein [Fluoribacter dumoffii]